MYSYTAYGLTIHSSLCLPELETSSDIKADVTIRVEKIAWSSSIAADRWSDFHITREDAHLCWHTVGKFWVRSGNEIIIDPLPDLDKRIIRLPLLGAVMAVLLHQRGYLVLHASAISLGDRAVAFVGEKGQGKSTMAATLHAHGHQLLADDIVAIDFDHSGHPIVLPGFPQFKLWSDAVMAIGDDPEALPQVHPQVDKRSHRINHRFAQTVSPLARVYVLQHGTEIQIQRLNPQQTILHLIANSYMSRFGNQMLQGAEAANHLRQCIALAKQIPICTLQRPRSLELLPTIAKLIETDLVEADLNNLQFVNL